jgi:HSP20 family protein
MSNIIKRDNGRQPATFGSVVDQIFQNNLEKFFDEDYWSTGRSSELKRTGNVPVNLRETDKTYEMEVIAPGLKKEDFHLNLEGDVLNVSFENKMENKEENNEEGWFRQEYRKQSFSRSFTLDESVDAGKISARYENGILLLQIPKKEHAQKVTRQISIQ